MATLKIQFPDAHRDQLVAMAVGRGLRLPIEKPSTWALAEHGTELPSRCGRGAAMLRTGWLCRMNWTVCTRRQKNS